MYALLRDFQNTRMRATASQRDAVAWKDSYAQYDANGSAKVALLAISSIQAW